MSTRAQCLWFLLALLPIHPGFHLLDAVITLGDRLPASTRMDLRELARQEIVQCLEQDHLEGPAGLIEAFDQMIPDPREKLFDKHLLQDPFLVTAHVQTVLHIVHGITILVNETIHRLLGQGYPSVAPQKGQVQIRF